MIAAIIGAVTVTVVVALLSNGNREANPAQWNSIEKAETGCSTWLLIIGLFLVGAFIMAMLRMPSH